MNFSRTLQVPSLLSDDRGGYGSLFPKRLNQADFLDAEKRSIQVSFLKCTSDEQNESRQARHSNALLVKFKSSILKRLGLFFFFCELKLTRETFLTTFGHNKRVSNLQLRNFFYLIIVFSLLISR